MASSFSLPTMSLFRAKLLSPRIAIRAQTSLDGEKKMRVPFELKQGQRRVFHELPSGLNMEVVVHKGGKSDEKSKNDGGNPPLVFVHGSYHAAWCWAEHWLPFFSASGYDCYAISLLGQGESDAPTSSVAGTLQTHAGDIADFIHKELRMPPVLIGHSFGGLIIQYYIANNQSDQVSDPKFFFPKLSGAVLVCSVPPTGNGGLVWRYLLSKPIAAFKVTLSLAAKAFQTSLPLCKETFFSAEMDDHLVLQYQNLMKESSRMPLFDLRKLNASLLVPSISKSSIHLLVVGASDDFIVFDLDLAEKLLEIRTTWPETAVPAAARKLYMLFDFDMARECSLDEEGLSETGRFYGVSPVCVQGAGHDIMLDCCWDKAAQLILSWLLTLHT